MVKSNLVEKIIETLNTLILTLLGVVVPIAGIMSSVFQKGFSLLKDQYERENKQLTKSLEKRLTKKKEGQDLDLDEIEKTTKEIKKAKKSAGERLSQLEDPKRQILKLTGLLFASLLGVLTWNFLESLKINVVGFSFEPRYLAFLASVVFFYLSLNSLWRLLDVLFEGKAAIDNAEEQNQKTLLELQTLAVEGSFLGEDKISVSIETETKTIWILDGEEDKTLELDNNVKTELTVAFKNSDVRMAKNLEIGLTFPVDDFLLEKKSGYSIYFDTQSNIVRYAIGTVQAETTLYFNVPLTLTALSEGEFSIKAFIKGENIKPKWETFTLKVTNGT